MQAKLNRWIHQQWQHKGLLARLLYPLSRLTAQIVKSKQSKTYSGWNADMPPIIIVGNIFVGGVGKTPAVISLCQQLKRFGWRPGVISRGYGVKIGPKPIAGQSPLDPQQVGDEPSMIAQLAQVPIAVHPNRRQAAEALLNYAPQTNVIISDDGLQHYPLPRAIEIIVQDERGVGNGWLLPAGPLREPATRLYQVDWILNRQSAGRAPTDPEATAYNPAPQTESGQKASPQQVDMWLQATKIEQMASQKKLTIQHWQEFFPYPCQALAGIGQPERFFDMLNGLGFELNQTRALRDHASIKASDLQSFEQAPILITAKDAIKLIHSPWHMDPRFWIVHVEAHFSPGNWVEVLQNQLREKNNTTICTRLGTC
ncbi:MAG TPA: tetraacyldisaccharide 4'-kinase [Paenalcaligenes sp.]|nr:tetraacyldisaccharide 4'-kinase [Paenalcaligenes sp.]